MNEEQAKALRAAFPDEAIGQLPKPYKKENPKGNCNECGGYHGLPAMHLDYVGHAAITDRLLQVDPKWTWEPAGTTEGGLPLFDAKGGLWIKLTVCDVTRYGYGDGPDPKQCISDAIRNAAMRFGAALDLWSKEDLQPSEGVSVEPSASSDPSSDGAGESPAPTPPPSEQATSGRTAGGSQAGEGAPTSTSDDGEAAGASSPANGLTFEGLKKQVGSASKARELVNRFAPEPYTARTVGKATTEELELALAAFAEEALTNAG